MIKFTCIKRELVDAVSKVMNCTIVKTTMPVLEKIKFSLKNKTLEITGFNLEYGLETRIGVSDVMGDQEGSFIVLPRILNEMLRRMDCDAVSLEVNENYMISIHGGNIDFDIAAANSDEFPALPQIEEKDPVIVKEDVLKSMIRQTKYATSNNEMKPVSMGLLFEIQDGIMHVVATDGYRLAICKQPVTCLNNYSFIIKKDAISLLDSFMEDDSEKEVKIYTNGKQALFLIDDLRFTVRLMEGRFTNYEASIPKTYNTEVLIDSKKLTSSLERCAVIIDAKNNSPVICDFVDSSLKISCQTAKGKLNDMISCEVSGPEVNIGFNNQFLLEASRFSECEKVKIRLSGDRSVVEILPVQGDDFIFLLMPIRVRK